MEAVIGSDDGGKVPCVEGHTYMKQGHHADVRNCPNTRDIWPELACVKNRFSDPTKEQKGQDWPRKDIVNRHQVRALKEGCHERKKAQVGVSSREKENTNRNLARVTTQSKSRTQTVSNGCVGRGERN